MNIIGTGIDILSIRRLEEKLKRTPALAEKILTPGELAYCKSKKNYLQHMAGRFAAKEAVYKVLCKYIDGLYFRDIEIESSGSKPVITEKCGIARILKEKLFNYSISISHEEDYAVAFSIFWKE